MAQAYAAVLQAQGLTFDVIGRSRDSAEAFYKVTGVAVYEGGLEAALVSLPSPVKAIVAVGVEQLAHTAELLLAAGCQSLLLEKPGALSLSELQAVHGLAHAKEHKCYCL